MKILRQLIFTCVAIIGLSMAVSAQKDDPRKPPKEKPPVVTPEKKPPRGEKPPPRDSNKPKKPEMSWFFASKSSDNELA